MTMGFSRNATTATDSQDSERYSCCWSLRSGIHINTTDLGRSQIYTEVRGAEVVQDIVDVKLKFGPICLRRPHSLLAV